MEVQTATDYLLGSFLSPTLNRRTDRYGGNRENRVRLICEVLEAVREEAGDGIAVGIRTSAAHRIPTDPNDYGPGEAIPPDEADRRPRPCRLHQPSHGFAVGDGKIAAADDGAAHADRGRGRPIPCRPWMFRSPSPDVFAHPKRPSM